MASTAVVNSDRPDESRRSIDWQIVRARMSSQGPDGRLLSATTGEETDAELREMAMQFTLKCPNQAQQPGCPFRTLQKLYHVSAKALISSMTRAALLSLFDLECEVRNRGRLPVLPSEPAGPADPQPLSDSTLLLRKRLLFPQEN